MFGVGVISQQHKLDWVGRTITPGSPAQLHMGGKGKEVADKEPALM